MKFTHVFRSLGLLLVLSGFVATVQAQQWYKGQLHCHSHWSDGNTLPELAVDWYKSHGFHFMSLTDHGEVQLDENRWKEVLPERVRESRDRFGGWLETKEEDGKLLARLKTYPELSEKMNEPGKFLLIPGFEQGAMVQGCVLHSNALNVTETIPFPDDFPSVAEAARHWRKLTLEHAVKNGREGFWMFNHPEWVYNDTPPEVLIQSPEIEFYENCNASSGNLHGPVHPAFPDKEKYWDIVNAFRIIQGNRPIYGIAADDTHRYLETQKNRRYKPGHGWVVVRSEKLDADHLFQAMKKGDFYSTTGVEMNEVRFDPATKTLFVEVKPEEGVKYRIRFVGTKRNFDRTAVPFYDSREKEKPARHGLFHSDEIGMLFKETRGVSASYQMDDDDLYVRAIIISNKVPEEIMQNEPPTMTAWTQPVGW